MTPLVLLCLFFASSALAGDRVALLEPPSGVEDFQQFPATRVATRADGGLVAVASLSTPGGHAWGDLPAGRHPVSLAMWHPNGELVWSRRVDTEGSLRPLDLAVDADGHVVMLVEALGRVEGFDDGVAGAMDALALLRFRPDGSPEWLWRFRRPEVYGIGESRLAVGVVDGRPRYAVGAMRLTPQGMGGALLASVSVDGKAWFTRHEVPEGAVDGTHSPGLVVHPDGRVTALIVHYTGVDFAMELGERIAHTGLLELSARGDVRRRKELGCSAYNRPDATIALDGEALVVRSSLTDESCAWTRDGGMKLFRLGPSWELAWQQEVPTGLLWGGPLQATGDGLVFLARVGDPHGSGDAFEVQWRSDSGRLLRREVFGKSSPMEPLEFLDVDLTATGEGWLALRIDGTAARYARIAGGALR